MTTRLFVWAAAVVQNTHHALRIKIYNVRAPNIYTMRKVHNIICLNVYISITWFLIHVSTVYNRYIGGKSTQSCSSFVICEICTRVYI